MDSNFERIVVCPYSPITEYSTAEFLIASSLFIIPRWIFSMRAVHTACTEIQDHTTTTLPSQTSEARRSTFLILVHFLCCIVISLTFFEFVVIVGSIPTHAWIVCAWFLHQILFGIIVSVRTTLYQFVAGLTDTVMLVLLMWSPHMPCGPTEAESLVVGISGLFELFLILVFRWRLG